MNPTPAEVHAAHHAAERTTELLDLVQRHGYANGLRLYNNEPPFTDVDDDEERISRSDVGAIFKVHARILAAHVCKLYDGETVA